MEDQDLCQLLEQLQSELREAKFADEKERILLHELETDIHNLLERCEAEQVEAHPLTLQRFEDAIDSMAVNHPTLTALLADISTILSNAGI